MGFAGGLGGEEGEWEEDILKGTGELEESAERVVGLRGTGRKRKGKGSGGSGDGGQ